jgi:hypothetical protein
MSDSTGPGSEGVRGGPNPHLRVLPGSSECAPAVLPTPTLVTDYLPPESLRKLNLVQLVYARNVTKAQLEAYDELIRLFDVSPTGVRGGPNP